MAVNNIYIMGHNILCKKTWHARKLQIMAIMSYQGWFTAGDKKDTLTNLAVKEP